MDKAKKDAIRARLAAIESRNNGRLTPAAVVEDATDPSSPLHDEIFKENDREAAYQRRLDLARELIRSIRVEVRVDRLVVAAPYYVRDPALGNEDQGYIATAKLRDQRSLARDAIEAELGRVVAALTRAYGVAAALDMSDEFEQLLAAATSLRERAREAA